MALRDASFGHSFYRKGKRLDRAARLLTREWACAMGVGLHYVNSKGKFPIEELLDMANGEGFDDVFVFASDSTLIQTADKILTKDGCLNFFAGPEKRNFPAKVNFCNIHYAGTHMVGTSGGNTEDMREALDMIARGEINPRAFKFLDRPKTHQLGRR